MIHEYHNTLLNVDVFDYTLTFDDGLLSQYTNRNINSNKKIFFICPKFIQDGHNDIGQVCMSLDNVKQLLKEGYEIGAHSYSHTPLGKMPNLPEQVNYMLKDTQECLTWFNDKLNIVPSNFCFPYNDDCKGVYKAVAMKCGFTNFYGSERTPIEKLLRS